MPRTEAELAWQCGEGELEILQLTAAGRDLRDAVPYVDLELNESAPHSWSLTIPDQFAEYHPEHVGGDWEGVMTDQHDHLLELSARWGGETLNFVGIPTGVAHQRTAKGGERTLDLTWSGVCPAWKLFDDAVTLSTLRSSQAGLVRRNQVITEAAAAVGVATQGLPILPPLRLQHRQNFRPGDQIQQYCERDGLGWYFDGETMKFFVRELANTPAWIYGPDVAVESESSDMANPDLYSQVMVRRIVESGDQTANPTLCTTYGPYSTTFEEPLNAVVMLFANTPWRGVVRDVEYRDPDGDIVAVGSPSGTIPYAEQLLGAPRNNIKSVNWTWGNDTPGSTYTEGLGQVLFRGMPADTQEEDEFPAEFETSFSQLVTIADLAAIVGTRSRELEVDETIGTQADALLVGQKHLERLLLNRAPRQLSCPLNLGVLPGQTIRVIDPILNRNQRGFVRRVRHRISFDPADCATVIEASGWRV